MKNLNLGFHLSFVFSFVEGCCRKLELESRGTALTTQSSSMGIYYINASLSNNDYTAYIQNDGSHTIMFDLRHGWRVRYVTHFLSCNYRYYEKYNAFDQGQNYAS